jgi:hypothetical protein
MKAEEGMEVEGMEVEGKEVEGMEVITDMAVEDKREIGTASSVVETDTIIKSPKTIGLLLTSFSTIKEAKLGWLECDEGS